MTERGAGAATALERAIADACLGQRAGDELSRDLRGFLQRHGVEGDDVNAVLEAPARLAVYRSLVRNGLSAVVLRMLPRTRARMNAACGDRFDADFARFVDEVGPRTHYLRDVPSELVAWAEPRWRGDPSVPGYLPDLASFELAQFAVSAAEAAVRPGEAGEVSLDRPLAFCGSTRVMRLGWAVHELPDDAGTTAEPAQRPVCLLAYRDRDHAVRWLELTQLAATLVERLVAGEPLAAALPASCAGHGASAQAVLPDVARLLADLGDRGILLGGASATPTTGG
jgi:hypothetical protein